MLVFQPAVLNRPRHKHEIVDEAGTFVLRHLRPRILRRDGCIVTRTRKCAKNAIGRSVCATAPQHRAGSDRRFRRLRSYGWRKENRRSN